MQSLVLLQEILRGEHLRADVALPLFVIGRLWFLRQRDDLRLFNRLLFALRLNRAALLLARREPIMRHS